MKITNVSLNELKTKLGSLLKDFQESPYRAAPEKEEVLRKLDAEHSIQIYLKESDSDWLFEERRMLERIFVSVRTIERIWALVFAYNSIVSSM